jgi:hypothetical protein
MREGGFRHIMRKGGFRHLTRSALRLDLDMGIYYWRLPTSPRKGGFRHQRKCGFRGMKEGGFPHLRLDLDMGTTQCEVRLPPRFYATILIKSDI